MALQVTPQNVLKLIYPNLSDEAFISIGQVLGQAGSEVGSSSVAAGGIFANSCGNIGTFTSAAGVGNTAVTSNIVLASLPIPALAFDIAARVVTVNAAGKFAANGNNKQINVYFGTDLQTVGSAVVTTATAAIAQSGVQTTNGGGWFASAQVVKYGAAGSNTQLGINTGIQSGGTHLGTSVPVALTTNESLQSYITITGASSTSAAANDVVCQWLELFWDN